MSADRTIRVAGIRAVEALAEVNRARVVRAVGFASVTLPDATYFAEESPC